MKRFWLSPLITKIGQVILPLGSEPGRRAGHDPTGDAARLAQQRAEYGEMAERTSVASTREAVAVRMPPDLAKLEIELRRVRKLGIASLAVVLKHAAIFPDHEQVQSLTPGCQTHL